eukprot:GHVQ01013301.1.p1 GENE.GHVQ01013301.1~~GHVQ01013301.1.p1  ORF type:complete len:442 (-),score=42.13 GHVQ01013301.1:3282-4607(-)
MNSRWSSSSHRRWFQLLWQSPGGRGGGQHSVCCYNNYYYYDYCSSNALRGAVLLTVTGTCFLSRKKKISTNNCHMCDDLRDQVNHHQYTESQQNTRHNNNYKLHVPVCVNSEDDTTVIKSHLSTIKGIMTKPLNGGAVTALADNTNEMHNIRKVVTGNYENRLKFLSTPEKVFEYFASIKSGGELFMSKTDFLDSLLPQTLVQAYDGNPQSNDSTSGICLTRSVFDIADANRDGRISFAEYLLFTTLICTPLRNFWTAFRVYSDSYYQMRSDPDVGDAGLSLTEEEFIDMMTFMISFSERGSRQRSTKDRKISVPEPRTVSSNKKARDICTEAIGGIMDAVLFERLNRVSEKNQRTVTWPAFAHIWNDLWTEILYIEFARCGPLEGKGLNVSLAAKDFAKMFVAYVPPSQMEAFSRRIIRLEYPDVRISFSTLLAFEECVM